MTAQERQAMWFLLALTVLGTGVRVVKGRAEPVVVVASDSAALAAQIKAVDSAVGARRAGKAPRKPTKGPKRATAREEQATRSSSAEAAAAALDISAIPQLRASGLARPSSPRKARPGPAITRIDVDLASQNEIEALPWVGPAMAARIIENRKRCGPFGSLEALQRVPGIGSGTAKRLSEHVTFSGSARPLSTVAAGCS